MKYPAASGIQRHISQLRECISGTDMSKNCVTYQREEIGNTHLTIHDDLSVVGIYTCTVDDTFSSAKSTVDACIL